MADTPPCLVYEALERIEIFSQPSAEVGYETGRFFVPGDLVSVDFVKEPINEREGNTGKYLRLSDGSGWCCLSPANLPDKRLFREVPVEVGLWSFFVDNFPDGLRLGNHPMDELQWQWQNLNLEQVPKQVLKPMHKIYCDRRVEGRKGVHFYRLQHGQFQTATWVYDKRRKHDGDKQHHLLVPEGHVQHGMFCFRAIKSLKLRMFPLANKRNLTGRAIAPNDLFVCDIIRGEKYYRMIDGSGWTFAAQTELSPVGIQQGTWAFRVTTPYGIKLQTQPEDDRTTFGDLYKNGEIIVCDGKLLQDQHSSGGGYHHRNFYHVQATNGWVPDTSGSSRDSRRLLERVSNDQALASKKGPSTGKDGWTEGFVRGVSMASMAGVTEVSHHEDSNLLSFRHPSGAQLQVFYATRTVGITEHGRPQVFCRNCTNPELVEIFKDPAAYAQKEASNNNKMEEDEEPQEDPETLKREEEEVRNQLITLDNAVSELHKKKTDVWKKVGEYAEKRSTKEASVQALWKNHMAQCLEEEEKLKKEEEREANGGGLESSKNGTSNNRNSNERCYVYRVLHDIGVRSAPNVDARYRTEKSFRTGDLVSIDSILDFVSANRSGPYLRLSDGSGWLFVRDNQGPVLEEVDVEIGLWNFYVGNEPNGIGLRQHPTDPIRGNSNGFVFDAETSLNFLKPFQKVSCDRKVVGQGGINFYRVQGMPKAAWILDKRFSGGKTEVLLHPASQVRTGMFAFEALDEIAVRKHASVAKKYQINKGVSLNEIIVADLIFEADYNNRNGPYLRLSDGSGWLFVNIDGDKVMKDIPIKSGKWKFRITHPQGVKLRKQPVDKVSGNAKEIEYKENQIVTCDREIKGTNGMSWYYRPVGRDGWLPNLRGKFKFMTEMEITEKDEEPKAWSVDLVRGIALAMDGLEEIEHKPTTQVVIFKSSEGATINVYYATQTVETTIGDPSLGKIQLRTNCSREELVEIFKDPVEDGCRRPSKRRRRSPSESQIKTTENVENDYRNRLMQLDKEEEDIKRQREALWKLIKEHEGKQLGEGDSSCVPVAGRSSVGGMETEQMKCPTCHKVFASLYAKQMHLESLGH